MITFEQWVMKAFGMGLGSYMALWEQSYKQPWSERLEDMKRDYELNRNNW